MASLLRKVVPKQCHRLTTTNYLTSISFHRYASSSPTQQQQVATASIAEDATNLRDVHLKPVSEVPGPRRYGFLGSFASMFADKDFKMDKLHIYWRKLKKEYGSIVRLDLPGQKPMVIIYDPDDCETLARATMRNPLREGMESLAKIRMEAVDDYFGGSPGLIMSNNEEWHRVRSRIQAPMMKPKNVTAYLGRMDEVTLDFLDRISELQEKYGEMPSHFQTELYKWSLEGVSLVALDRRFGCLDPNLKDDSDQMILIREANNMFYYMNKTEMGPKIWRFFPTPAYWKMKKSHSIFLKHTDENIRITEERLKSRPADSDADLSLMEILLLTPGLTRKDVVTLILDMMFAGIDTTAHTVAFTMYLLARNPEVQTKLQNEIDSVLGDQEGLLKPQHLAKLPYMKAVLKESLRVYPLGNGTMRTLDKDLALGGYLIPKGFMVGSWNMFMAEDETQFPKAGEFIPERWMRDRPMGSIHPFASLPFGLGTRMCVGRRIAEQEMYTFIIRVMQRFNVDYRYGDMDIITKLINVPASPLHFSFTERRK